MNDAPVDFGRVFATHYNKATEDVRRHETVTLLRDFLSDESLPRTSAHDLAQRAVEHFCIDESDFNGNVEALRAIVAFLGDVSGHFVDTDAIHALRSTVAPWQADAFHAWQRSHFPMS